MVTKMSLLGISSAGLFFYEEGGPIINIYKTTISGTIKEDKLQGNIVQTILNGQIRCKDGNI